MAIRKLLDAWIAGYPEVGGTEILSRFRSGDDTLFLSAFFELYIYTLLSRLGYGMEVHPSVRAGGEKRPDFLLHGPDKERLYLEAILATETSAADRARQSLRSMLVDILNDMESPNFFVNMKTKGLPNSAPSTVRLKRDLRLWLDSLDPDLCLEMLRRSDFDQLPEFEWEHDGWRVKFQAHPKSVNLRGKSNVRTIGIQQSGIRRVDPAKALRKALKTKISRYGELEYPYVVAVNFTQPFADIIAVEEALFGTELMSMAEDQAGKVSLELERAGDGILIGNGKPRNTRLSAVLIAISLHPTTIASTDSSIFLYHNPWAKRPYEGPLERLTHYRVEEGRRVRIPGLPGKDILGVDPSWLYEGN
ncbi:MAG TPA: hypothetical protein VGM86_21995 [Thermoanaerobaculia bacterium]|jgi:hypothetical protein